MSELIEIHQLDYKACSLTYSEGACTASSSSRPTGETVAAFNGSTSKISTTAVAQADSSLYEYEAFIKLDSYTGARKVFGEYNSTNNGFTVKINSSSINVYLQKNPIAYGKNFFFSGYDFLSGETLKVTLEKKAGSTNQTVCKVYINGNFIAPGSSTNSDILLGLDNYTLLEIGQSTFGSSLNSLDFAGTIKNFTVKKDGVLVRDLPLLTNADDLTGNTTPVATDVFTLTCPNGVDPNDPTQCALIENPDGKCFNTYATCQDIANYSQTSKTLTFAKKQAAALPLESLQRVEGNGAQFNGSTSKISLTPCQFTNEFKVECYFLTTGHPNNQFQMIYSDSRAWLEVIANGNFQTGTGKFEMVGGGSFLGSTQSKFSVNTEYKITYEFVNLNLNLYIDDVLEKTVSLASNTITPYTQNGLGTIAARGNNTYQLYGKIWGFKAYKDGVLVRDLPLLTDATDTTGNSTPTATDVTFTGQLIDYKAALPHIPLLDSSSTKSGELNIGARRSVSGPLGKYSSASVTMTDEAYSDNLTDPYISERTYNPLERGTFWSKFLAQNPYHEGDTYRIYNGEAGQDLASMPFKQFIVDRITAPNSGGNVSIKLVDQFRKLDPAKAVFLNLGVNKLKGDITANDIAINTTYVSGEVNDINSLQPYLKIGSEIIGIGAQTTDGVTIGFNGCTRGMFGTTAQNHSSDTLIQPCHYFYPSTVLPEADRGLYYYLQTLFNAAGINDSFLDLTGWQDEINARLSLFNNVKRLVTKAGTTVNKLLGELQRDCGFFMWFDETDKKIKLKAVRPEGAEFTLFENKHLIAGKTSHSVESEDRITDVWVSHTVRNQAEDLTDLDNYKDNFVLVGDGSNPYKYGQRSLYEFRSPWIQNQDQARLTTERVLRRYDDSIKFINFSLDHTFDVRMGQVFKLKYSAFTDASGAPLDLFWQVIGLDRVDNEIKIKAQEFYFGFGFVVYGDSSIPNYDQASEEQQNKYGFYNISKWG